MTIEEAEKLAIGDYVVCGVGYPKKILGRKSSDLGVSTKTDGIIGLVLENREGRQKYALWSIDNLTKVITQQEYATLWNRIVVQNEDDSVRAYSVANNEAAPILLMPKGKQVWVSDANSFDITNYVFKSKKDWKKSKCFPSSYYNVKIDFDSYIDEDREIKVLISINHKREEQFQSSLFDEIEEFRYHTMKKIMNSQEAIFTVKERIQAVNYFLKNEKQLFQEFLEVAEKRQVSIEFRPYDDSDDIFNSIFGRNLYKKDVLPFKRFRIVGKTQGRNKIVLRDEETKEAFSITYKGLFKGYVFDKNGTSCGVDLNERD